jgi:hypothetical protein
MLMLHRAAALTEFTGAAGNLDRFADADGVDRMGRGTRRFGASGSGLNPGRGRQN